MKHARVSVEHVTDLPNDLPAVWEVESECESRTVRLWLQADLPRELKLRYRAMCVLDALPEMDCESFTVLLDTEAPSRHLRVAN